MAPIFFFDQSSLSLSSCTWFWPFAFISNYRSRDPGVSDWTPVRTSEKLLLLILGGPHGVFRLQEEVTKLPKTPCSNGAKTLSTVRNTSGACKVMMLLLRGQRLKLATESLGRVLSAEHSSIERSSP